MIDRAALEDLAHKHVADMRLADGSSLLLHLVTGETFAVRSFEEFLDSYCVVAVYPQQALAPEDLEKVPKDSKGHLMFDRLVLPYPNIVYVTLTVRELEKRGSFGFG